MIISATAIPSDLRLVLHRELEARRLVSYYTTAVKTSSPDQFRETYLMLMSVSEYNYLAELH
jgi:hypothetical protein